ncbi:MAG: type III pantothenate kinase [Gammaproteobacteria bacterium]|nr:type III pantothenate kinase [Gammaproteobacteria bacterium]MCP5135529.1 type III pantothenate kinase [Gammaproteobacteria bacterium]
MIVLIDVGNTAVKVASCAEGDVQPIFRARHRERGLTAVAVELLAVAAPPTEVWLASVLSRSDTQVLRDRLQTAWACRWHHVETASAHCGVEIAYAEPDRLGVDRWLALIAAHAAYPGDKVIADLGSALTVDVLRADGKHLGGIIVPGFEAILRGLNAGTALGPVQPAQPNAPMLGVDTDSGIASGAMLALAGAVEGSVRLARERHGLSPQLLITGGDAENLAKAVASPSMLDEHLVMRGLALLSASGSAPASD